MKQLITFLLLIITNLGYGQSMIVEPNINAEDIIEKYLKVTGLNKLKENDSYTYMVENKTTMFQNSQPTIMFSTIVAEPSTLKMYIQNTITGIAGVKDPMITTTIITGNRGWAKSSGIANIAKALTDDEIKQHLSMIDWIKMNSIDKDTYNRKYIHTISKNEKKLYGISMFIKSLNMENMAYYDSESGLLISMSMNINGITSETYILNYKKFGNINIPSTLSITIGDKNTTISEVVNFVFNYPISNIDFSDNFFKNEIDAFEAFNKGLNLYSQNSPIAAIGEFDKAISVNPNYMDAHLMRLRTKYICMKDYDGVINNSTTIIGLNTGNIEAYTYRALAYIQKNNLKEAEKDLSTILEYQNNNELVNNLLSCIKELENDQITPENNYTDQKQSKFNIVMNLIKDGLGFVEAITSGFANIGDNSYQNSRNSIGTSYGAGYSKKMKKESCSSCNGTGKNSARERPSFYNYTTEEYMSSTCGTCGSSSNHYHKDCSSCGGKGVKFKY